MNLGAERLCAPGSQLSQDMMGSHARDWALSMWVGEWRLIVILLCAELGEGGLHFSPEGHNFGGTSASAKGLSKRWAWGCFWSSSLASPWEMFNQVWTKTENSEGSLLPGTPWWLHSQTHWFADDATLRSFCDFWVSVPGAGASWASLHPLPLLAPSSSSLFAFQPPPLFSASFSSSFFWTHVLLTSEEAVQLCFPKHWEMVPNTMAPNCILAEHPGLSLFPETLQSGWGSIQPCPAPPRPHPQWGCSSFWHPSPGTPWRMGQSISVPACRLTVTF